MDSYLVSWSDQGEESGETAGRRCENSILSWFQEYRSGEIESLVWNQGESEGEVKTTLDIKVINIMSPYSFLYRDKFLAELESDF